MLDSFNFQAHEIVTVHVKRSAQVQNNYNNITQKFCCIAADQSINQSISFFIDDTDKRSDSTPSLVNAD